MTQKSVALLQTTGRLFSQVWVWLPLALIILLVIALILLPYLIRHELERWLIEQGAEQVRIEDVDFNFFLGRLSLRNAQIRTAGERTLTLPQASLGFARWPLLQRRIVIDEIFVRDITFTLDQDPEGNWRIAGLGRPDSTGGKGEKSAWRFSIQRIDIVRSELHYRGNGQSANARIERAQVLLMPPKTAAMSWGDLQIQFAGHLEWHRDKPAASASTGITADIKAISPKQPDQKWRFSANAELRQPLIRGDEAKQKIAAAERVTMNELSLTGADDLNIHNLTIGKLILSQPTSTDSIPPLARAEKVQVKTIKLRSDSLSLDEVRLAGFHFTAQREKSKRWYGVTPVRDFIRSFDADGPKKPGRVVRVETIAIEEAGVIDFIDLSVKPVYETRLTLTQARLTGFDTTADPEQPMQVSIAARIGKYSKTELNGQMRRLWPKMTATFDVKLRELDLPVLSGYTSESLGYRMTSGQLNGALDMKISADKLDGAGKLEFANFNVESLEGKSAEELQSRMSVPLESGLSMLRDKNNNVNLAINISGDIGDPKFDLTDAINQALGRAVRTASLSYLKYYFQPFGTLIAVAELAGKARQLRLDPVIYAAGTDTPVHDMENYLDKLGKLLQQKKNLRLRLCGKAVRIDNLEESAATELATRRAERLKDRLVSEYGIATDRLFQCAPELDRNAQSQPRVELIL